MTQRQLNRRQVLVAAGVAAHGAAIARAQAASANPATRSRAAMLIPRQFLFGDPER
jgi:hypothetical protein